MLILIYDPFLFFHLLMVRCMAAGLVDGISAPGRKE